MASLWTLSSQADAAGESAALLASTAHVCAVLILNIEITEADEDYRVILCEMPLWGDCLEVQGGLSLSGCMHARFPKSRSRLLSVSGAEI